MAVARKPLPELPNGIVASAINLPSIHRRALGDRGPWVDDAWHYYDTIGELRYVSNWVGNIMGRAHLRAVYANGETYELLRDGPAEEMIHSYFGGHVGQVQMMQTTGVNLVITGEAYHVYHDGEWMVLASGKVTRRSADAPVYIDAGDGPTMMGPDDLVVRVWTPHPRDRWKADSPTHANMHCLQEIEKLNQHLSAQLESRLAGAGILFMPSEMQFAKQNAEGDPAASQADAFMDTLAEAMMTPIKDRGSASAVVPIIVTAPGDLLSKVDYKTFWSELDGSVVSIRDACIRRLATGLDTPPEVLLGMQDSNHWNAWMVEESAIKGHLEPRLQVLANAITTTYLRPALEGIVPDPENYQVVADTSSLRLRPNRTREAIELYDRGQLSPNTLLRETGFSSADVPTQDEFERWLLIRMANGSTTPEQSTEAAQLLGIPISTVYDENPQQQPDNLRTDTEEEYIAGDEKAPDMERSRRNLDDKMERGGEGYVDGPLLSACDVLVLRALERAGNKLCDGRAKANGLGQIPAHLRYLHADGNPERLLTNAWGLAPDVLTGLTDDVDRVVSLLDLYTTGLITHGQEHDRGLLERALAASGKLAEV